MFITLDFPSLCSRLLIPSFDVFCFRLYSNFLAISSKLSGDFRDDSLSFVSQTGEMFYGFRVEFKNVSWATEACTTLSRDSRSNHNTLDSLSASRKGKNVFNEENRWKVSLAGDICKGKLKIALWKMRSQGKVSSLVDVNRCRVLAIKEIPLIEWNESKSSSPMFPFFANKRNPFNRSKALMLMRDSYSEGKRKCVTVSRLKQCTIVVQQGSSFIYLTQ